MAAADVFSITVQGKGGHAALPHKTVDPIFIAAQIVSALQGIAARNADPLEALVVSITRFNAGDANNVIPQSATLTGTARTLKPELRSLAKANIHRTVQGIAAALGGEAIVNYELEMGYPVTVNNERETAIAASVARDVAGAQNVDTDIAPVMGAEDFSFMLEARPGAFIFLGNGDSASCHHPAYDFNDGAIPAGVSYWARLAETVLTPAAA
jgi:hippurate hydrolase